MNASETQKLKVAFVVGEFPVVSETFIINQVADLIDRGVDVSIFTLKKGDVKNVSDRYFSYKMEERTRVLEMSVGITTRIRVALPKAVHFLRTDPVGLLRSLNFFNHGRNALSLKLLFWSEPFLGCKFDLVHCHFGPVAYKFLIIKDILKMQTKVAVTFYGYDVSHVIKVKGIHYYDRLIKEASLFFTMSENMKQRIVSFGFPAEKVISLPVSIDVASYPFVRRAPEADGVFHMLSIGRFVEKKGFDDLLRTLAILKIKTKQKFMCHIIGGPKVEEKKFVAMAESLGVGDLIEWKGYMKVEDIIPYFLKMQLYVQTSKTAANGDME